VRVHVAFTPGEEIPAELGIVVDVLRATSVVCQALSSGYARVLCCGEVDEARATAAAEPSAVLAGERELVRMPGFDFGNSPREFVGAPASPTLVLTTTNGTRLLLAAAARCEQVLIGSLLNLAAVAAAARASGADEVAVLCAGVEGELTLDDAYCAGRIAAAFGGNPTDSATAAIRLAASWPSAEEALGASQSGRNLLAASLDEDIVFCAKESVLDVVPRFAGMRGTAAEVTR
jgi:2-phosphosulfolactate phosphatase